ncbi:SMI1/KNR4 family protein [Paraflavitalea pollutisoli]|uniref:SMI1/KNR4 family protein n=1 Tax=Paraflavitalea pollutisoli TaxID=3034143 RepID=UPI0023EB06E1|nr:SMI1/KNR4 family protein [Paraflavitalea sp. H1-2-19X]
MTNIEILQALSTIVYKIDEEDEDEDAFQLTLLPPATETELQQLADHFPKGQLPAELEDLLRFSKGWKDPYEELVHLNGFGEFGYEALMPLAINLQNDGLGNCWLLEVKPDGSLGKVFFACHDPAVLVITANSLNEYLQQQLLHFQNPDKHPIGVDHPSTGTVYLSAPNMSDMAVFKASNPSLTEWLLPFTEEEHVVADLRQATAGDGFYWGKCQVLETRKHPTVYVWILQKKKKGWLARLFGK